MSLYDSWDPETQQPDYDRHPSLDVRARWIALCYMRDAARDHKDLSQLLGICEEAENELQHALDAWTAKEAA